MHFSIAPHADEFGWQASPARHPIAKRRLVGSLLRILAQSCWRHGSAEDPGMLVLRKRPAYVTLRVITLCCWVVKLAQTRKTLVECGAMEVGCQHKDL